MPSRIGIRCAYSLLWGTAPPGRIISRLAQQGCTAVAITDKNNLYGLHRIREAAREAGIRHVTGAQLDTPDGPIFAFVSSKSAYRRLCALITNAKNDPGTDFVSLLAEDAAGLLLVCCVPLLLERLAGKVPSLWAGISPWWVGSISTARRLGLPLAAIDDASCLSAREHEVHRVLRAIASATTVGTLGDTACEPQDRIILDMEHYGKALSSWPEALAQTEAIVDACADIELFDSLVFPDYPADNPKGLLRSRVLAGAERRYGELSDAILGRIDYELGIINRKGFAPYFLVMDDIVAMASRTCGRGSGAASIVSYALGITNVDPIAYNLYFERFLTMARTDPPDIDVDFAWDERDDIIRAVIRNFGETRCARVANHNRFQARSAIRETAKAYGLPDGEISRMEHQLFESGLQDVSDPLWHTICAIASHLEGLPRAISMHCGGLVITPGPVTDHAPVERSAQGYPLLAWEKEGTEAAALVKIDLLGNRSLAVIRDALANLGEEDIVIDTDTWRPAEDAATQEALARGDSLGVFYIESPAMRQLQRKTGKGDFDHIVIHSSIIRPAANAFINEYVRRLKGGAWEPLHPRLGKILGETYGILCYQEDVSKTAVALAGFSEAQADTLRKVIAKKASGERLSRYEKLFREGCDRQGIPQQTVTQVWDMMLSFDGYSFCKPHSASYAMVSFQSAYLRVHHPAAFMAAVLSNQGGYYHPQAYISEIRRMGLTLAGPDINRSRYRYHAEGTTVVIGFMAIANLGSQAAGNIIAQREGQGPFRDLGEVSSRLDVQRDDLVALVAAGVFDSLDRALPRSAQLRILLTTARGGRDKEAQGNLFASEQRIFPTSTRQLSCVQRNSEAQLHQEFESLGFLREHHPLLLWARQLARIRRIRAIDLDLHVGRSVTLVGWPITRKTIFTKGGLPMDFISFEDETALYETVLFPQTHQRYRRFLHGRRPLVITGKVRDDQGAVHVEVISIRSL